MALTSQAVPLVRVVAQGVVVELPPHHSHVESFRESTLNFRYQSWFDCPLHVSGCQLAIWLDRIGYPIGLFASCVEFQPCSYRGRLVHQAAMFAWPAVDVSELAESIAGMQAQTVGTYLVHPSLHGHQPWHTTGQSLPSALDHHSYPQVFHRGFDPLNH